MLDSWAQRRAAAAADARFLACLALVLGHEGGFVNHPSDPGGATNMGITLRTLGEFRGRAVSERDVRTLTRDEAAEIYRARYWLPMRCGDLPAGVDLMAFDFGVNAGPGRAVKMLQRVVGTAQDGAVGPHTLAAVRAYDPGALIITFADARRAYYRGLDTFPTFGRGWMRRTDSVELAALAAAAGG